MRTRMSLTSRSGARRVAAALIAILSLTAVTPALAEGEPGASDKMWASGDSVKQTQSAVVLESLISQFLFSKAADAGGAPAPAPAASGGKK